MTNLSHSNYPHEPGYLIGCPACEDRCHCGPGVAEGTEVECVWEGHSESFALCPACGSPIDYCQGHGDIGDSIGAEILRYHDSGNHSHCHPLAKTECEGM